MFKSLLLFVLLALTVSVSNAETYKWEDADGVHFTDNPYTVPKAYRNSPIHEPKEQPRDKTPQIAAGAVPLATSIVIPPVHSPVQQNEATVNQANVEQQRRAREAIRLKEARARAFSKNLERTANSLAEFMVVWLMIGLVTFATWLFTIVDIVKSEFVSPSNKTVWVILVLFLPLLGTVLYCIFGHSQKRKATDVRENNSWKSTSIDVREFPGRDFDIH